MLNLNFKNTQLLQVLNGILPCKEENIRKAITDADDRKLFTLWVENNPKSLDSKLISLLYNRVRGMDREEVPQALQSFPIQTVKTEEIKNLEAFSFTLFLQKDSPLTIDELFKMAQCYSKEILSRSDISRIFNLRTTIDCFAEGLPVLFEKLPQDFTYWLIENLAKQGFLNSAGALLNISNGLNRLELSQKLEILCPDSGVPPFLFLDASTIGLTEGILSDLIDRGLNLQNENYLDFSYEEYEKRVQLFEKLINLISNDETRVLLHEKLNDYKRQEQRLLLQYTSIEEKQKIKQHSNHPELPKIIKWIEEGNWMALFKELGSDADLSYSFLAAHRQGKISLDDLATAMIYHRAYYNKPDSFMIYELNEETLRWMNVPEEKRQEYLRLCENLPKNQRNLVTLESKCFDHYTKEILERDFFGDVKVPGIFKFSTESTGVHYAMVSFGIAKAFFQQKSITLAPIIHLTPELRSMTTRILKNMSDFVILFPQENVPIHGSKDMTIFAQMHDLFHGAMRLSTKGLNEVVQEVIKILSNLPKHNLPPYEDKIDSQAQTLYRKFAKKPTQDQLVHYLVNFICNELIDGNYREYESVNFTIKKEVNRIVEIVINDFWSKLWMEDIYRTPFISKKVLQIMQPI